MRRHTDTHHHHRPDDRRNGRQRPGPGPFDDLGFGPGFGAGGPGRPGRPRGRRRGGRGGDVRAAALLLLAEEPQHGYQLIQEIGERSEGAWTPSPGSIYPVLQQLEDEGLISFERVDGRKTATLTPDGTAYVDEHRTELGTPWKAVAGGERHGEMRELAQNLKGLVDAWKQVAQAGTPEQRAKATQVVDDARRALYQILAD